LGADRTQMRELVPFLTGKLERVVWKEHRGGLIFIRLKGDPVLCTCSRKRGDEVSAFSFLLLENWHGRGLCNVYVRLGDRHDGGVNLEGELFFDRTSQKWDDN
jgi:hypothetical protein